LTPIDVEASAAREVALLEDTGGRSLLAGGFWEVFFDFLLSAEGGRAGPPSAEKEELRSGTPSFGCAASFLACDARSGSGILLGAGEQELFSRFGSSAIGAALDRLRKPW